MLACECSPECREIRGYSRPWSSPGASARAHFATRQCRRTCEPPPAGPGECSRGRYAGDTGAAGFFNQPGDPVTLGIPTTATILIFSCSRMAIRRSKIASHSRLRAKLSSVIKKRSIPCASCRARCAPRRSQCGCGASALHVDDRAERAFGTAMSAGVETRHPAAGLFKPREKAEFAAALLPASAIRPASCRPV